MRKKMEAVALPLMCGHYGDPQDTHLVCDVLSSLYTHSEHTLVVGVSCMVCANLEKEYSEMAARAVLPIALRFFVDTMGNKSVSVKVGALRAFKVQWFPNLGSRFDTLHPFEQVQVLREYVDKDGTALQRVALNDLSFGAMDEYMNKSDEITSRQRTKYEQLRETCGYVGPNFPVVQETRTLRKCRYAR